MILIAHIYPFLFQGVAWIVSNVSNPAQNRVARPVMLDVSQFRSRMAPKMLHPGNRILPARRVENASRAMAPNFRRFRNRLHQRMVFFADWLKASFAAVARKERDFKSLRVCPFCGLITSREKTCCLECGKSLKVA